MLKKKNIQQKNYPDKILSMNLSFQPAPQHSNIFWGFPRTRKVRSPPWDITLNGPPSTGQPQSSLISVILQDLVRLIWSRSRSFVSSRGVFCLLCERNQPGESLSTGGGTPAELQQTGPAGWSEIQTKPSSNNRIRGFHVAPVSINAQRFPF